MITITGQPVWPSRNMEYEAPVRSTGDITGGVPSLFDIGTGLSRTARFAGQTKHWYSVLQHVLTVAAILPEHMRLYGLLHDAAEAVVGDQVTTWKNTQTRADEHDVMGRICGSLGVQWPWPQDVLDQVLWADRAALRAEALVLEHYDPYHDFFVNHCPWVPSAIEATRQNLERGPGHWTSYGYGGNLYAAEVQGAHLFYGGNRVEKAGLGHGA